MIDVRIANFICSTSPFAIYIGVCLQIMRFSFLYRLFQMMSYNQRFNGEFTLSGRLQKSKSPT